MAKEQQTYMQYTPMAWTPGVYQPQAFTPQVADMSILQHSLGQIEERHNKAIDKIAATNALFGELKTKVHNDPVTQKWLSDYSDNVMNQIQASAAIGDYGTAINVATDLAGKTANDNAVLNRIEFETGFQKEKTNLDARLANGKISRNTYEYGLAKAEEKAIDYKDSYDANGNVLKAAPYTPPVLYDDADIYELFKLGFATIHPDVQQWQNGNTSVVTGDGTVINKDNVSTAQNGSNPYSGITSTVTTQTGGTRTEVTTKDVMDAFNATIRTKPDYRDQMWQMFEVEQFAISKLEQQKVTETDPNKIAQLDAEIDARKKEMCTANGVYDYNTFIVSKVTNDDGFKRLYAYKHTATTDVSGVTPHSAGSGPGGSGDETPSQNNNDQLETVDAEIIDIESGDVSVRSAQEVGGFFDRLGAAIGAAFGTYRSYNQHPQ